VPFAREQISVAAGFFVQGSTSAGIAIKSMTAQPGYLWSFPRPDHVAVGICAPASERTASSTLLAQSQAWIQGEGRHRRSELRPYSWPIPSIGSSAPGRAPASGRGWMLLGDAAGLVDPLTREGIYYALLSGVWAAEALMGPALKAPYVYQQRLDEEIHPELARAAALSALFFSPRFSALLVDALRGSERIRTVFQDLVAGLSLTEGSGAGCWQLGTGASLRVQFACQDGRVLLVQ
jgi:flavin-dependent dehydrogenase